MKHVKILDCTLRDGGYLVDSQFGDIAIKGIISSLVKTGIDVIECGFLKDTPHEMGSTIFNNATQVVPYLPKEKNHASFVLLADYSRYSIENLEPYDGTSIDGVRACFFKHERYDVLDFCKQIKIKGYKLYIQPVDILGYSDEELLELLVAVNLIQPYSFSIVDTFGSMYKQDLQRIFYLVNHNLSNNIHMGFHSHNNLQMSFSLSQEFTEISQGLREVIIDSTVYGMGRGAGNTNTELIIQFLNKKYGKNYDIDKLLDLINNYIENIRSMHEWGYSIPYYIAGMYSAHVNNISYLVNKAGITYKDIRYILNELDSKERKRYDYDLLERRYINYTDAKIDDSNSMKILKGIFTGQNILILLPGKTIKTQKEIISRYITDNKPIIISINVIMQEYPIDYIYFSNKSRLEYWKNNPQFNQYKKIITSNIQKNSEDKTTVVIDFTRLIKCGWENLDNSGILLLRLLDLFDLNSIAIAGFDGYIFETETQYANSNMEKHRTRKQIEIVNEEIDSMLLDYSLTRTSKCEIKFITESRFKRSF